MTDETIYLPPTPSNISQNIDNGEQFYAPSEDAVHDALVLKAPDLSSATKEVTGFASPDDVVISYNSTTRKVTISGTTTAYHHNQIVVVPSLSDAHSESYGSYFYCYDGTAFKWLNIEDFKFYYLLVCYVYYTADNKFGVRESHGLMQWQTHFAEHYTIGTWKKSGGGLSDYTPNSTTASERRPSVASSYIVDEDLTTLLPALTDDKFTLFKLTSTGITSLSFDQADIVPLNGAIPYYNQYTTGWVQTPMSNNSHMAIWLIALPATSDAASQKYRYIFIQGQSIGTLAQVRALLPQDISLGDFTGFSPEFVFISKIIIQYTAANWKIIEVQTLSGTRASTSLSPQGAYLTHVETTSSFSGAGTATSPLALSESADIETTGYIIGKKSGVFAYLSASANTTITSAATYYPIAGTFSNNIAQVFTGVATPAIRYDGTETLHFEIDWHASFKANTTATTVKYGIKKNGTLITGSEMGMYCKYADELYNLSGTCVVELTKDDEIQLVITSDGDGDIISNEYFTTTINRFF